MTACALEKLVDCHFAGRIRPAHERTLREHLPVCDTCHSYYERHLVLERLDPAAPPAERRLAIGLGVSAAHPSGRAPLWLAAAATVACFAVVFLRPSDPNSGFQARGSAAAPRVWAYRVSAGEKPVELVEVMRAKDELAFAFDNPAGAQRLLLFGIDEHRHVYWYHPAWVEPGSAPQAVPIARGRHELPEAVSHELSGDVLTLYAVFTNEAPSVREVEGSLGKYTAQAAWTQRVRVTR